MNKLSYSNVFPRVFYNVKKLHFVAQATFARGRHRQ